ncbi:hypothetical protein BHM03_00058289, partial [Ensete ventricosum]
VINTARTQKTVVFRPKALWESQTIRFRKPTLGSLLLMASKRARLSTSVEADSARAKLEVVAAELGHEIRVFLATSQTKHAALTTSDAESQILKTQKMREAEAVACRERLTKVRELYNARVTFPQILLNLSSLFCYPLFYFRDKHNHQSVFYCLVLLPVILQAVIRVRFPDDYILEANFQPSETIQTLVDLLMKVVARPNLPFFLFTTPPKQRIADLSKDFYSAGFAPGANVYFSYDVPESHGLYTNEPFLREDIRILSTLDLNQEQVDLKYAAPKPALLETASVVINAKPMVRSNKPKWFRR